jgi:hypothetical protein
MFLEFYLVFLHIIYLFFEIFKFQLKNQRFLKSDPTDPTEFWWFLEKLVDFFNAG